MENESGQEEGVHLLPSVFPALLSQTSKRKEENTPKAIIAHSNISIDASFIFKYTQIESRMFVSGIFYLCHQR